MEGVRGSIPLAPTISMASVLPARLQRGVGPGSSCGTDGRVMKVKNSLKSLRGRHRDNRVVRRKGRVYVINKTHKRFKARQG